MFSTGIHGSRRSKMNVPKADFYTSDDQLLIVLDMPGVSEDELHVTCKQGQLHVQARSTESPESTHRRAFQLSESYDASLTRATIEHGVVRLEVPKRPEAKTVRIPVAAPQ